MRRVLLVLLLLTVAVPATASAAQVRVGVGRADVTPVTGGYKGGWACGCARALGQHTRLYARAIVLQQGTEKLALVTEDLAFLSAGMVRDAVALAGRGFTEQNVIVSATHTHGSQTGFMNFGSYNSVLPKSDNLTAFDVADTAADPVMYDFMTRQLAQALVRADDDLAPGAVGWGHTELLGVTQNRSLEAHLADDGIVEPVGAGSVDQDPGGYADTIDPSVDVLRVDQMQRGRRVPVGMYSGFANHGTTVKPTFPYFTADHMGSAERVVESTIRREGRVPRGQDVVNAFADTDAGDQTSGIAYSGPAAADWVGRREAAAMLRAWRGAGRHMRRSVKLGSRWTRVCFCGQETTAGAVDDNAIIGLAAAAGSEELRTGFYDAGLAREGATLPEPNGPQGVKVPTLNQDGSVPAAVPVTVARVANRLLLTVPGEPTVGVGQLLRAAVGAAAGPGIRRTVVVGYANEYLSYFATPAEYDRQHYEGGFTLYGRTASLVVRDTLVSLAQALAAGAPAPEPFSFDPSDGVKLGASAYGSGATSATATEQPSAAARLGHPAFGWTGGADGIDRPVDTAFVSVQRRVGARWVRVTDDLGLQVVWDADADGAYRARWEVPRSAPVGSYRFRVTGKQYRLVSQPFTVGAADTLTPVVEGGNVTLRYPEAVIDTDWTARPQTVARAAVTFTVDNRPVRRRGGVIAVPAGTSVTIAPGAARDRYGNTNAAAVTVR